jgi:2'-5' RNA ligase
MRLFVGLAIADEVKQGLERVTLRLRAKDDGLRWSTADQWHVTLAFLGEVGDEARGRLVRELAQVRVPQVGLQMDALGVFQRVGILLAKVEVTPELLALYEAVAAAVRVRGWSSRTGRTART